MFPEMAKYTDQADDIRGRTPADIRDAHIGLGSQRPVHSITTKDQKEINPWGGFIIDDDVRVCVNSDLNADMEDLEAFVGL
jgi:hypothetical protein